MQVFVGQTGKKSFLDKMPEGWGRLWSRDLPNPRPGEPWALDNYAFSYFRNEVPFNEIDFLERLHKALERSSQIGPPEFAVVPDIVGGGWDSMKWSLRYEKICKQFIAPARWNWYLVVQDGMEQKPNIVEGKLKHFDGIFLGGTEPFKATAKLWADMAHKNGLKFHYGRCGTQEAVTMAMEVNADSIDSSTPLFEEWKFNDFINFFDQGGRRQMRLL